MKVSKGWRRSFFLFFYHLTTHNFIRFFPLSAVDIQVAIPPKFPM